MGSGSVDRRDDPRAGRILTLRAARSLAEIAAACKSDSMASTLKAALKLVGNTKPNAQTS